MLGLGDAEDVYAVLDDDGTEVDEEEYFQLLEDNTVLMVLTSFQAWTPAVNFHG